MTRRVFFSFHFERDIWRVNQVRNLWVCLPSLEEAGYIDAVNFEKLKRQGDAAVQRWINVQMHNTSVTVVLIGAETAHRHWVQYEIGLSLERGNGLLGIYIHGIRDQSGRTDYPGPNPLDMFRVRDTWGRDLPASSRFKSYDWEISNGRKNLGAWVEEAAVLAGRVPLNTNKWW